LIVGEKYLKKISYDHKYVWVKFLLKNRLPTIFFIAGIRSFVSPALSRNFSFPDFHLSHEPNNCPLTLFDTLFDTLIYQGHPLHE
jgi:hypothetical protein